MSRIMLRVLESSMAFSIKNPEVDRLVREVCSRTGESLTTAIEVALRERLDRLDRQDTADAAHYLDGIRAWQASLRGPVPSMGEFAADHYDASGLPR